MVPTIEVPEAFAEQLLLQSFRRRLPTLKRARLINCVRRGVQVGTSTSINYIDCVIVNGN